MEAYFSPLRWGNLNVFQAGSLLTSSWPPLWSDFFAENFGILRRALGGAARIPHAISLLQLEHQVQPSKRGYCTRANALRGRRAGAGVPGGTAGKSPFVDAANKGAAAASAALLFVVSKIGAKKCRPHARAASARALTPAGL